MPGDVWLTETGGLVSFGRSFPPDEARAAKAVRYAIKLARDNERVKRAVPLQLDGRSARRALRRGPRRPRRHGAPAYDALRAALASG